jgi:Zn-dependent peptidase ImmA (M78 family)
VTFRPAVLSYDDLRRLAQEFLEEFHEERTLPVPIEEIVEFDFEIEVIPMEGILDDLEVDAFLTSDLKQIYVDAFVLNHRYRRYRFSLAHELAHHELHRPLYDGTRIRSVRDSQAVQDSISEDAYAWLEFQANSFAGLVLAPTAELADQYRAAVRAAQEAGLSDETLQSEAGKAHVARWLADQFEVSELVIEKRMEKDGLWSPPSPPSTQRPIAKKPRTGR